eukprot:Em0001g1654a
MASDELTIFRRNFDRLKAGLDVHTIADAAYSAELISNADLEQCAGEPDHRKATVFVAALERGVRRDIENFHKFLKILKDTPAHSHLLADLM